MDWDDPNFDPFDERQFLLPDGTIPTEDEELQAAAQRVIEEDERQRTNDRLREHRDMEMQDQQSRGNAQEETVIDLNKKRELFFSWSAHSSKRNMRPVSPLISRKAKLI